MTELWQQYTAVGIGFGIIVMLSGLSSYFWKRGDHLPKKWQRIGTLASVQLFPIKSCAPLHLSAETEITCDLLGLRLDGVRDRGLMLIDDNDEMITARVYPRLVLIRTQIVAPRKLLISYDGMPELILDFCSIGEANSGRDVHVAVWGAGVDAMLCGREYDEWFSSVVLGKESGLRLIYFPYPKPIRTINHHAPKEPHLKNMDTGAFHDTTSYMLMNLASIDDLNARLTERDHVDPLQFRGNFYVKMDEPQPYAEDKWQWVKIGSVRNDDDDDGSGCKIFRVVAPCTRCILPNISVVDGTRNVDCQPLKTLKKYRMTTKYSSPLLGVHLGLRSVGNGVGGRGNGEGKIKLGDIIYIEVQ